MFPLDPVSMLDVTRLSRGSMVSHLTKSGSVKYLLITNYFVVFRQVLTLFESIVMRICR